MAPVPLDIVGALGQIGAPAAQGWYGGELEGLKLGREFKTEDLRNQLRQLELAIGGKQLQQMGQPVTEVIGNHKITRSYPGGPITNVEAMPLTPLQQADLTTKQAGAQDVQVQARIRDKMLKGEVLSPGEQAYARAVGLAKEPSLAQEEADVIAKARRGETLTPVEDQILRALLSKAGGGKPHVAPHYPTDKEGNVTEIITTQRPDGTWEISQIPLGRIGTPQKPERGPRARQSVKAIRIDAANQQQFQTSINEAAMELTGKGILKPDNLPYVIRRDGTRELKTDVVRRKWQSMHPNMEIEVAYNPGTKQFEIVRAWEVVEQRDLPSTAEE